MAQSRSSSTTSSTGSTGRAKSSGTMGKAGGPSPQIVLIELKQRILAALNKLADRDTQHIAVEDLERIAETLSPEGISLCLSCLYDTDSQQKTAVRKECVKMFGTLASLHNDLLSPHLAKIVANIVRRLKDPDSSIRDACVDAMGTLATKVSSAACLVATNSGGESGATAIFSGPLGVFAKPLFDALNEQNRGVQAGAAMCLAGVIDNFRDLPAGSLQRLCPRIIKLLNGTTFTAKAALLSVIASIVQAGGATSHQCLAMLMACVLDCLKSNDWATRKAASETLTCMASSSGPYLGSFKIQALEALEACRFDKVKPVRDTVVQTLQVWKRLSSSDSGSDASAVKENYNENQECHAPGKKIDGSVEVISLKRGSPLDLPNQSFEGCFGFSYVRSGANKISSGTQKKRAPLIDKRANPEFFQKLETKDSGDWQIDIAVPKLQTGGVLDASEMDFTKQQSYTTNKERTTNQEHSADQQEFFEVGNGRAAETWDRMQMPSSEVENQVFEDSLGSSKSRWLRSKSSKPDTWLTPPNKSEEGDSGSWIGGPGLTSSCSSSDGQGNMSENDSTFIRRQLCQIEHQQAKLLELLQKFICTSEESFSKLDARVVGMENVVDDLVRSLANGRFGEVPTRWCGGRADLVSSKLWKKVEHCHYSQDRSGSCESIPAGRGGLRSSDSSLTPCEDARYGPAVCAPLTGNPFSEAQAGSWRVHVDVSSDSLRRVKNEAEGSQFINKKVLERGPGTLKLGEGPSARSIWQASKDEATLAAIRGVGEDARLKNQDPLKTGAGSSQSSVESRLDSSSHRLGGQGKGSFWSLWSRAAEFLRSGDVDSAYVEVLCAGDELLLVRLMSRTGPVLERLSSGTAHELLRTIIQLLLQQSFLDVIIPWMEQVADIVANADPDCMGLSFDAKRGLITSLEEASAFEYSETWIAKRLRELSVQLGGSWGLVSSRGLQEGSMK